MSYQRNDLDKKAIPGPPTIGGARRSCGKCSKLNPASGSGGKKHPIYGWIGPCCVKQKVES